MACDNSNKPTTNEINTETCAVNTPCAPLVNSVCSTQNCNCGCNPCTCGNTSLAGPTPYYNQACGVEETHTQVLNTQTFVTNISTGSSFNMPLPGNIVTGIVVPGLQVIQVGSWLWNSKYGYLRVISFDASNGTMSVTNEDYPGNASPGTLIPACTQFNVVDPPFDIGDDCDGDHSFLTQDFVIPNVGSSVTISVSNLLGILVTRNVQIGVGTYRVTAIIDANTITITNEGSGDAPGITVYAKDSLGHCISPVTAFSDDPCAKTTQSPGALVICHNGVSTTLNAATEGQIPVCIDAATNEVEFQTLSIPTDLCTWLTACLNLINGTLSYTLVVNDSTGFNVEDILILHDVPIEGYEWVVTNVIDNTHIAVDSVSGTQTLDVTIPTDTPVCAAPCCDQILYKIGEDGICNRNWSKAFKNITDTAYINETGTVVPLALWVGSSGTVTVVNDTCNDMVVSLDMDYVFEGSFNVNEGDWASTNFEPWFGYDVVPIGDPHVYTETPIRSLFQDHVFGIGVGHPYFGGVITAFGPYDSNWNKSYHGKALITLTPGTELQASGHLRLYYANHKYVKTDNIFALCLNNAKDCAGACGAGIDPLNLTPLPTHNITIKSAATALYAHGVAMQVS